MKVPQSNPSPAGMAGGEGSGEGTHTSWGGGERNPKQEHPSGTAKTPLSSVLLSLSPTFPSPLSLILPASQPQHPGCCPLGQEIWGVRWHREPPQPWLPGARPLGGAPGNILAFGYLLLGGEVCQGCTKHCLSVLKGIASVLLGLLLLPWPQRASLRIPCQFPERTVLELMECKRTPCYQHLSPGREKWGFLEKKQSAVHCMWRENK